MLLVLSCRAPLRVPQHRCHTLLCSCGTQGVQARKGRCYDRLHGQWVCCNDSLGMCTVSTYSSMHSSTSSQSHHEEHNVWNPWVVLSPLRWQVHRVRLLQKKKGEELVLSCGFAQDLSCSKGDRHAGSSQTPPLPGRPAASPSSGRTRHLCIVSGSDEGWLLSGTLAVLLGACAYSSILVVIERTSMRRALVRQHSRCTADTEPCLWHVGPARAH